MQEIYKDTYGRTYSLKGETIVIVTHDPSVAEYCSRKIVISDGKII